MLLKESREEIVKYGNKMLESNLTTGSGGNLSIYNREANLVAISPSGLPYYETRPEDIVIVNLQGEIIEGKLQPSSELNMHLIFYKNRPDVNAVMHTHSVFATTISCLNEEIPAVHYLVAFGGNKIPCADYATYGTQELAENAWQSMGSKYQVGLLANHGLLAVANDMSAAFNSAEEIEFAAELYYRTRAIGEPVILNESEMDLMQEKFKTYGQVQKNQKVE